MSFETNIESAHIRKSVRYHDLKKDIENEGFEVDLIPFEVGSRGQVTTRNRAAITNIFLIHGLKKSAVKTIKEISKIALLSSFTLYQAHHQRTWQNPPYLAPRNVK